MAGLMIAIGKGPPKKGGKKSLADEAFADYMREKGKAGASEDQADESEEDVDPAEETGRAAAQEFASAAKSGDAEAIWESFKRMKRACDDLGDYAPPEAEDTEAEDDEDME